MLKKIAALLAIVAATSVAVPSAGLVYVGGASPDLVPFGELSR